jgi:hypothetical protein
LEVGHSDRAPKAEPPPVGRISAPDFQHFAFQYPEQTAKLLDTFEIHGQLGNLITDQLQKDACCDPIDIYLALDSPVSIR